MQDKGILEGTAAIAQFMGLPGNHLKYHERWDYLMPVCKKIKELALSSEDFTESMKLLWDLYEAMHDFDIQKVYPPVVSFCKWYNSHQK